MTRTATILAFTASVSLWAQTPSAPPPSITVSGCVAAVQRDGSTGPKATGTQATPETAPFEANNPEPTNRFQLVEATPTPNPDKSKPTTYALRGQDTELAKHVGHRVEIAGGLMAPLASKLPSKAAATAETIRTVQVTSVKMIGTNCSVKPER
jgi:hypothetical protein